MSGSTILADHLGFPGKASSSTVPTRRTLASNVTGLLNQRKVDGIAKVGTVSLKQFDSAMAHIRQFYDVNDEQVQLAIAMLQLVDSGSKKNPDAKISFLRDSADSGIRHVSAAAFFEEFFTGAKLDVRDYSITTLISDYFRKAVSEVYSELSSQLPEGLTTDQLRNNYYAILDDRTIAQVAGNAAVKHREKLLNANNQEDIVV
jgi:hypothetical protein